ncbi:MAG TPA: DNA polymerase III subunit beta [Phycisphaerales bacterium]|nr:DNA polymerase III subunit beta [Phycisphaerales bacterium]
MKVICDRAALFDAMSHLSSVVAGRTPSPVLQCVSLSATKGLLTLAGTDQEVGLRMSLDKVDVQKEGSALVPADKLAQIIRACEDPTITLEAKDNALHIKGSDAHFKIFGFDAKEAPAVRTFDPAKTQCEIPASALQTLIGRTLFAAATEHSRYAINGVLFDREGKKLRCVATDGRRLALARGECTKGDGKSSCIVPIKALGLLNKLIRDPEALVHITVEPNHILFSIGEGPSATILSSNLVEGAFPPFEDVIPKDQDKKVTIDSASLSSAIRRAALLTNEESKGVRLSFEDKKVTLTSRAPEMGEAEIHLDVQKYVGEPLEIGFNPYYIADAMKVLDHAEVIIELKAPNKPGVLKTGNDFTYVVMPVNLT